MVAREVPQCAVYFLTYDAIRRACDRVAGPEYQTAGIVLAGGSAGVAQWVATKTFSWYAYEWNG